MKISVTAKNKREGKAALAHTDGGQNSARLK